jgi:hypothetical protein
MTPVGDRRWLFIMPGQDRVCPNISYIIYAGMRLPAQHVEEAWQSAEFWANKVLMEFRNSEAVHVAWVKHMKELLMKLRAYVQKHHKTGPAWNPTGKPVSSFTPTASGALPCPPRGLPWLTVSQHTCSCERTAALNYT